MSNLSICHLWLCDALEAQFADAARVHGRPSGFEPRESMLAGWVSKEVESVGNQG